MSAIYLPRYLWCLDLFGTVSVLAIAHDTPVIVTTSKPVPDTLVCSVRPLRVPSLPRNVINNTFVKLPTVPLFSMYYKRTFTSYKFVLCSDIFLPFNSERQTIFLIGIQSGSHGRAVLNGGQIICITMLKSQCPFAFSNAYRH